jgi:hypothetical protein
MATTYPSSAERPVRESGGYAVETGYGKAGPGGEQAAGSCQRTRIPAFTVLGSLAVAGSISVQASLGFLGFGPKPPSVWWGQMMSGQTLSYVQSAPWLLIAPGVAISLSVYAFKLFGDSLNDWLRPRDRRR